VSHDLDDDLVRRLASLLDETGLGEIEYASQDFRIRVARPAVAQSVAMPPAAAPASPAPAVPVEEEGETVASPIVGTAYLAPEPNSANFISVGDKVTKGQTLMIVEAMKVMNPIPSPSAGTVKKILIDNGQPVEYGQPLVVLE